ncbi:hypothetical protein diail_2398 [Diaporthe ilicicola]|nr:hypothetical protein diail_2398 [Diaporthe ilicicola]
MAAAVHGGRAHIEALREQIEDSLVTSISERRFLPIDKVGEIFTLSAVKDAVQELNCQPEHRINLAETIHDDGKAVFAMLIDMWQEDLIIHFREHGVLDEQFPLDTIRAQEIVGPGIARRLVSEVQWKFLPYVFPERMWECRAHIADQRILPFVSRKKIGSGAFGEVEKISVYPSQQNFAEKNAAEVHIVQKRLIASGVENEFEREDKCLRLLHGLRHPNIVQFLGSYTHKKEHNFLFPYIETDLGKVLSAEKRHGGFQWDFTFYAALTGLASALANTHHLVLDEKEHGVQFEAIGYHHDLRPPNVLVSHDSFILADFGLGSLKDAGALSNTPYKIISGDYIAPECTDMEEIPQTVNRAIDVWAFGCLILEVVTYMLKGPYGVKEFRDKRHTPGRLPRWKDSVFYQPQAGGGIKDEVLEWIEGLRRDTTATDTEAYLMKLGQDALQADPRKRPTMDEMHRRLAEASILKHFDSVQDMFQTVRSAEGPHASNEQHHLESLRLAQERVDFWGRALSLREIGVSSRYGELTGKPFEVVTTLFHTLREEPEQRASGDSTSLRSFEDCMDRRVTELWDLLPSDLVVRANEYLGQNASDHDLHEQVLSPSQISHDQKPSECATPSADTLLREFEDLTQSFKNGLSESVSSDELTKTKSLGNVYDLVDDLQHNQELRNLPKMELFLKRLHSFTEIVDDTIRGSCEYFQWIWGPLGLLLRRSRGFDMAYIAVIDAMAKIGEALPDFHAPDAFLRQNAESKEILVLFFKDLLEFYSVTLRPFRHPGWAYIFDRSWPKIWELVLEVSSHISRLTRLMRTEISLEHIQKEDEFRKNALEAFQKQARETRQQEFNRIKTSFRPREYHDTLYELRGVRSSGSGSWLFRNKVYTQWWFDNSQVESQVLWLKGIPGAGKTVLSSTIIDHLKNEERLASFAFLTYKDERISALSIMHSLIFQLAERDVDLVDAVCESMSEELKNDLATATDLLKSLILHAGAVCLVIDGVDEISIIERGRMIAELLELFKSCEGLRMILSSRPEADLVRALDGVAVVIQVHDHNEQNIEGYVKESTQKMFRDRGVLQRDQDEIRMLLAPLAGRAKGMFLYARLIMEMVATMYDLAEIREELAVLPENLDDAYHRIILRLDKHGNKIHTEKAKRLLGWIACTSVPLTIEEAQQALAVNPRNPEQTYSVFAKLDPVEVLGPIVETTGGYIRFVHFTAKE